VRFRFVQNIRPLMKLHVLANYHPTVARIAPSTPRLHRGTPVQNLWHAKLTLRMFCISGNPRSFVTAARTGQTTAVAIVSGGVNPTHIVALSNISYRYLFAKPTVPPLNHCYAPSTTRHRFVGAAPQFVGCFGRPSFWITLQISQLMVPSLCGCRCYTLVVVFDSLLFDNPWTGDLFPIVPAINEQSCVAFGSGVPVDQTCSRVGDGRIPTLPLLKSR
jgi:hypothetical protein